MSDALHLRLGFGRQLHWSGTCARYALRHALLCAGIPTTERELTRGVGKNRIQGFWGLDEERIKSGLSHHGCQAHEVYEESAETARDYADEYLAAGLPLIVCVENWDHWAVVCGRRRGGYAVIDSAKRRIFGTQSWPELRRWLRCAGEELPYYFLAVEPPRGELASLVPRFPALGKQLRQRRRRRRRRRWGVFLALLRRHFRPDRQLTASEFFGDNRDALLARSSAPGDLADLEAVAEAHRLTIDASEAGAAVEELGAALSAGRGGGAFLFPREGRG